MISILTEVDDSYSHVYKSIFLWEIDDLLASSQSITKFAYEQNIFSYIICGIWYLYLSVSESVVCDANFLSPDMPEVFVNSV